MINNKGEIVELYRKLHLFDVDTPDFKFRESKLVKAGNTVGQPVETIIGKIGLQIVSNLQFTFMNCSKILTISDIFLLHFQCYDIRFAESSLILAQSGAEILTYPSAFAFSTGTAHWDILNRCRAIENQCYVISAAQIGNHNAKRKSYGHAVSF